MNCKRSLLVAVGVVLAHVAPVGASAEKSDVDVPVTAFGEAKDSLRCGIILPKQEYKVGDTVTVTVLLQNEGAMPLRVVRYNERKNGHRAHFKWEAREPKGPSPFTCECLVVPFQGEKAETVVLGAGEVYGFRMTYKLVKGNAAFPVMSVSYFVGKYDMDPYRKGPPAWVVEVTKESPLWQGIVRSGNVAVRVTE